MSSEPVRAEESESHGAVESEQAFLNELDKKLWIAAGKLRIQS